MKFDNSQFQKGITSTLSSLASLDKGLKLDGASKGFETLNNAANKVSLAHLADSLNTITSRFTALGMTAVTTFTNITNRAIDSGIQLVKSITVAPIMDGLREYETQLNSVQTILANTGLTGQAGLDKVNGALLVLNEYSDQTIYNFGEMARNIGTFTAAGVKLGVSVDAIKGIANLAAVSGSSSMQASSAMYQLSQALAAGTVKLMDWNSVVNAGMGGKVFQDSLLETARVHGIAIDSMIKDAGSFRDSLEKGWLSSEILTETLSKFAGDLNAKQLKTMGYSDKQIAGILQLGKTAQDAATKVKTFSQLVGTLQEAVGSGWSQTWQMLFGDFEEAKILFTNVNNVIGGMIGQSADARNKMIGDWKALGGRTELINAIANAFNALMAVVKPVGQAFRQIFPQTTGKQLYDLTIILRNFTEILKIGGSSADKIRRSFAGVFAVFDIGFEIIKKTVAMFVGLFGEATEGSGAILDVTARIGDFLVSLRNAVVNGDDLTKFFDGLGRVLAVPIKLIKLFVEALKMIGRAFADINVAALERMQSRLEPLGKIGDLVSISWGHVAEVFVKVY